MRDHDTDPVTEMDDQLIGESIKQERDLSDVPTCELVEELRKREGVLAHHARPYALVEVKTDGPAIVLVVTD